jgi:para-nitrobenzyl esterase
MKLSVIVSTRYGQLQGEREQKIDRFRGIAFARPPVGDLRFRAPEPPESWPGVRDAKDYGPSSPQVGPVNRVIRGMIGAAGSRQSQDCLYLNVWTPGCDGNRRPVMFWIHGGAFILGSGAIRLYDGARLARRGDVVVVTINYRLGALGFLDWKSVCGQGEVPQANLGTRDQVAALEWVRDNIEAFGGDPENVTVFGESAGAMSTATLLGVPKARGLFHKAILQSGAAHNVSRETKASRVAGYFTEALGLDELTLEKLQELPITEIMGAQVRASVRIGLDNGMMAWQPTVDGDLIPEQPLAAVARGDVADVPLLIGTNRDEFKLFTFTDRDRLDDAGLVERVHQIADRCDVGDERLADRLMGTYGPIVGERNPGANQRWVALQSDRIFHYPAARLADLQAQHQPKTYSYLFDWQPPILGRALGSCHGLDLPFVFGGARGALLRAGLVADRAAGPLCDYMQDAWISFAQTGEPHQGDASDWPAYELRRRYTKGLGAKLRIFKDPHEAAREFWEPLIPDGEVRLAEIA